MSICQLLTLIITFIAVESCFVLDWNYYFNLLLSISNLMPYLLLITVIIIIIINILLLFRINSKYFLTESFATFVVSIYISITFFKNLC
jgi:hypothetical protein